MYGYNRATSRKMIREVTDALRSILLEGGVARLPKLGVFYVEYCRMKQKPTSGAIIHGKKDYARIRFRGLRCLHQGPLRRLLDG